MANPVRDMYDLMFFVPTRLEAAQWMRSRTCVRRRGIWAWVEQELRCGLVITGVGPRHLLRQLERMDATTQWHSGILLGAGGSLNRHWLIGQIVAITKVGAVIDNQVKSLILEEVLSPEASAFGIMTGSAFSVEKAIQSQLGQQAITTYGDYSIVDMESYYFADFARSKHKRCQIFRVVSDYADEKCSTDFRENLKCVQQQIVKLVSYVIRAHQFQLRPLPG